jgi:putative PIN family toxin of toxin-antitoxin system
MNNKIISKLVIIDTNVCLDLFVFHDPRWILLLKGLSDGSIRAVTRADCRSEWLAVLHYSHLPVSAENRSQIIDVFDKYIQVVSPPEKEYRLPSCTDKDDQKFLEIARDAEAETLITKDKALLKLARKVHKAGYYSIETPDKFVLNLISTIISIPN